ncbi:hypothetical protein PG995_010663 [Apiospora arundinis]
MQPKPMPSLFLGWATLCLLIALIPSSVLADSDLCPFGGRWCQDRCITDLDTCCDTPQIGTKNACGKGTICCGFGCCLSHEWTCNADFSCTGPQGQVIPPAPAPDGSKPMPSSVASIPTGVQTNSFTGTSTSDNEASATAPAQSPTRTATTDSTSASNAPAPDISISKPEPPLKESTSDDSKHTSLPSTTRRGLSTSSLVQGSDTSTSPSSVKSTAPTTQAPSPLSSRTISDSETGTKTHSDVTSRGSSTSSLIPGSDTTQKPSTQSSQSTSHTEPAGQVVIVGSKTATLPVVTTPSQVVTLDQTFPVQPQPPDSSGTSLPTLAIVGSQTLTLPLVKTASVLTTLGTSFALQPPQEPTTRSASSVVVFDGSSSFNIPPLFQKTTLTTGGRTVTVSPEGPPTITIEKPPTGDASSTSQAPKVIIVGGSSITIESIMRETVLTTNGQVLTLAPDMPPTVTANQPPSPITTTTEKDIGPLPVYKTWPAGAVITPVAVEVDKPKKSDDDDKSSVIPCKLWFFSLCIKFEAINILG